MTDGGHGHLPRQAGRRRQRQRQHREIPHRRDYGTDQYSQIGDHRHPLTGGQWIGAAVRAQAGGQNLYLGLYYWQQRHPRPHAVQALNGSMDPAGLHLRQRGPGRRHPADAQRRRIEPDLRPRTASLRVTASDTSVTGGGARHHGLRHRQRRQLGRRHAGRHLLGRRHRLGPVRHAWSSRTTAATTSPSTPTGPSPSPPPLASGATYNVTVADQPTGQTCTVTNGTATDRTANITNVAVTCTAAGGRPGAAADNFNGPTAARAELDDHHRRRHGHLPPDGDRHQRQRQLPAISAPAETYASDQYSQIVITSTPLSGGQWIGVAVRAQSGGQNLYLGLYCLATTAAPSSAVRAHRRQLDPAGHATPPGPCPPGTTAAHSPPSATPLPSRRTVSSDHRHRCQPDRRRARHHGLRHRHRRNWAGGNAGFRGHLSEHGRKWHQSTIHPVGQQRIWRADSAGSQPTHPAAGRGPQLPVSFFRSRPDLATSFGDGLATLQALDAQDQYNLTIVEPTFINQPWYANNPTDPNIQYETFMTNELVPWVKANLATTGTEQNWLIGFSKSGVGARTSSSSIPNLFALAASWDFPADISSYDEYAPDYRELRYRGEFCQANYQLTPAFLSAHAAPFKAQNRIWIGGYSLTKQDISDYDALLKSQGIAHTDGPSQNQPHAWESSWVSPALAALYQDSLALPPGP